MSWVILRRDRHDHGCPVNTVKTRLFHAAAQNCMERLACRQLAGVGAATPQIAGVRQSAQERHES